MSTGGPQRRRRRPAVSCTLCRRRKTKCNRETPCSNCVKSRSEPCVYDNPPAPTRPQEDLGFTRTFALDSPKAAQESPQLTSNHSPRGNAQHRIETGTSQLVGAYHISHGNHLLGDLQAMSRSVMHKSRLFGQSHWAHAAMLYRDVFEMLEPHVRDENSKVISNLKRCKELARAIKAQRTPRWPTPPTQDLPAKGIADELVDCYLRTIETTFRILHIPTFKRDYDSLWLSETKPSTAFLVQLKLVLAIGAIAYDEQFSMRASAIRWVYEAHTWLSDPDFKSRLNIQSLQTSILLVIARETTNVNGDSTWISAGALLRTALFMGLHRDPSHLPNMTPFTAEMRRRLWNTVLEINLQSSMLAGGAPLISIEDFDTEPPSNLDDDQLLTQDPLPKSDSDFTQSSVAIILRKTFPQRLAILKFLNDFGVYGTYEETLRLDAELRASYRAVSRTLHGYRAGTASAPSFFEIRMLDFIIHTYISCLHMPFFAQSLHEARYAFSRKVVVESSLKVWCAAYPSSHIMTVQPRHNGAMPDNDRLSLLVSAGDGFFRTAVILATVFISVELKTQLQDEDSLGPSPYRLDLVSVISEAKERNWKSIEAGETNVKSYLLTSMIFAQIDGLMQGLESSKFPEFLLKTAQEAEERYLAFYEEKAVQGYGEDNRDASSEISANQTPSFVGDWNFIMTDSSFNFFGSAEPMSWVFTDESLPFM